MTDKNTAKQIQNNLKETALKTALAPLHAHKELEVLFKSEGYGLVLEHLIEDEDSTRQSEGFALKPSLSSDILNLLMLMANGVESAITKLAQMIIASPNAKLVTTIAKMMQKGNPGAQSVLGYVNQKAPSKALQSVMKTLDSVSSEIRPTLEKAYKSPTPFSMEPRPTRSDR